MFQFRCSKMCIVEAINIIIQLLYGTCAYQYRGDAVVFHEPGDGHLCQALTTLCGNAIECPDLRQLFLCNIRTF